MAETQAGMQVSGSSAPPAGKETVGAPPADRTRGSGSLFRNAYFLMLSTGVSAVLGLGFWLVAARYYSEEAVGQGSAAIAAMRLLAGITATTMIGAVVRFVPRAGRATGSLVWRAYAASSVVVAVAAVAFLLTLDLWGATYAPLGTAAAGTAFVVACVAWALLTLQDGVLTGLRRSGWVPVGNAVFSVGKLFLLAVCATALPVLGIFVSWAVAIAFSTLPLGWLIFHRLIPRQAAADHDLEPPRLREMGRFLAGDSLGALFSLAMINLLPVMVAVRFSAADNGYFYVAYTVGGTMEFMAINMASSLTAHASHDPRQLAEGVRGALRRMTLLLVPVVLFLVVFAPRILLPFQEDYAEHGTTVLRLLAAGALPRVVVELYIGVLRVQGRTVALAALQGAMCVLVLGSAALLFGPAGIAGAGWAVLISMTLIAAVSAVGLRSALRADDPVAVDQRADDLRAVDRCADDRGAVDQGPADHRADDRGPERRRPDSRRPDDRPPVDRSPVDRRDVDRSPVDRRPVGRSAAAPVYGSHGARLNATAGYGTTWARRAAHAREGVDEDTVALFVGRPGYEREALLADTPTLKGRPAQASDPVERGEGAGEGGARGRGVGRGRSALGGGRERWVGGGLWGLLGLATVGFWVALRDLPWFDGPTEDLPTGRRLLAALPPTALAAGGLLLVVFVGAVTLRTARGALLPGTALASVLLALYAVPCAFGRQPTAVDGGPYAKAAGSLAAGTGLDGPEPLLRWAPPAVQLLCLVPLWLLLARADRWLTWPGRWGLLHLVAVGGWVWRRELAPAALPLLVVLVLAAVFLPLATRARAMAGRPRGAVAVSGRAPAGGSSRSDPPPGTPRDRRPR
ncbi:lipopolysaccharide biosynthesis protein [Streptomyces sp. NBRC 110468]|uniref:lipopolysaccharide biosynthesis protein n=1 Tax=Streptomyces maremycinicus TaxID=1679753 RepID=UPI000786DC71|nr:lipopolysaccharide biosynthesis protein [Streptomyces sp. NBRC 110468]